MIHRKNTNECRFIWAKINYQGHKDVSRRALHEASRAAAGRQHQAHALSRAAPRQGHEPAAPSLLASTLPFLAHHLLLLLAPLIVGEVVEDGGAVPVGGDDPQHLPCLLQGYLLGVT